MIVKNGTFQSYRTCSVQRRGRLGLRTSDVRISKIEKYKQKGTVCVIFQHKCKTTKLTEQEIGYELNSSTLFKWKQRIVLGCYWTPLLCCSSSSSTGEGDKAVKHQRYYSRKFLLHCLIDMQVALKASHARVHSVL